MFKIAVCDDEQNFRSVVKEYIDVYMQKREMDYSVDTYESGEALLDFGMNVLNYTIVFLDINMERLDGMKTAQRIRAFSDSVFIVFVTAYVDYTLEGYKVNAIRYLLKNKYGLQESIEECLDTIFKKLNYVSKYVMYRFQEGERRIPIQRIVYIESRLHKLYFYVIEENIRVYTLYKTLNEIEKEIADKSFIRIHQSYLINMKYIQSICRYEVNMFNGITLGVSKVRYSDAVKQLTKFKGDM